MALAWRAVRSPARADEEEGAVTWTARTAIKWMLCGRGDGVAALQPATPRRAMRAPSGGLRHRSGSDEGVQARRPWPLTFDERARTAAALCDVIIPAEDEITRRPRRSTCTTSSTSGSARRIRSNARSRDRRGTGVDRRGIAAALRQAFHELSDAQQTRSATTSATSRRRSRSSSCGGVLREYRDLTAGGFYTTPAGMKDIGYIGNVPLDKFDGPPLEVLRKAGLA